jgi:dTDP-glucose 4,6-dehydratase
MGMADKPIVQEEQRMRPDASEVMKLVSDNRKAHQLMGWLPLASVDQGLQAAIDFIDGHRHLYRTDRYVV